MGLVEAALAADEEIRAELSKIIAAAAHMANRAVCQAQGDNSQVPWEDAPDWQCESAIKGVLAALKGATPEQSHEGWCAHKRADGWTFGQVKDAEAKTHPCLVPYAELPAGQKLKDEVYIATVRSMAKVLGLL